MQSEQTWNVRQLAKQSAPVSLVDEDGEVATVLDTRTAKAILLAHLKVTRAVGVKLELFFMEGGRGRCGARADDQITES